MWLLGLMNLGFLAWVIVSPIPIAEYVGLSAAQPRAGAELRAMYGGLIGGLGVLNIIGARSQATRARAVVHRVDVRGGRLSAERQLPLPRHRWVTSRLRGFGALSVGDQLHLAARA